MKLSNKPPSNYLFECLTGGPFLYRPRLRRLLGLPEGMKVTRMQIPPVEFRYLKVTRFNFLPLSLMGNSTIPLDTPLSTVPKLSHVEPSPHYLETASATPPETLPKPAERYFIALPSTKTQAARMERSGIWESTHLQPAHKLAKSPKTPQTSVERLQSAMPTPILKSKQPEEPSAAESVRPLNPAPLQRSPAIIVRRRSKTPKKLPPAFWERNYLSHIHLPRFR